MYFVIKDIYSESNVFVSKPPSFDDWDELTDGVSLIDEWPDNITLEYSKDYPEGLILTDQIANPMGLLIISKKFKSVLETLDDNDLEYLPIKFIDHKGRTKSDLYWIVNFTSLVSALDKDNSIYKGDPDGEIDYIKKLVLLKEIEDLGPPVFRFKQEPYMILFRKDIKDRIEKQNLTGFKFVPTEKYVSLDADDL